MLRGLVGVVVGLGYGVLVGGVMFLIRSITGDPPVDLMLDYNKIFRFVILLAVIITGSAGALVGLMATLLRVGKIKAGMIGFSIGLLVLAGVVFKIWPQLEMSANVAWSDLGLLCLFFVVLMIMFPIGLAATGVTASVVEGKFVSTR